VTSTPLRSAPPINGRPFVPPAATPGKATRWSPGMLAAVVLAGIAASLLLGAGGYHLLSTTRCEPYTTQIDELSNLISAGQTNSAVNLARLYRDRHDQRKVHLCNFAYAAIASVEYLASKQEILSRRPGVEAGGAMVSAWREAEQRASAAKVRTDAPMTVFGEAMRAHMWELARAAFLKAWEQGTVGPEQRSTVMEYYAALRNGGGALAFRGTPQTRDQGVLRLATAHAIDTAYGLGSGVACLDMQALGYRDCSAISPDLADPVLVARRK
jgi:hypothetical protein